MFLNFVTQRKYQQEAVYKCSSAKRKKGTIRPKYCEEMNNDKQKRKSPQVYNLTGLL